LIQALNQSSLEWFDGISEKQEEPESLSGGVQLHFSKYRWRCGL
jgi:hypothetical protein